MSPDLDPADATVLVELDGRLAGWSAAHGFHGRTTSWAGPGSPR